MEPTTESKNYITKFTFVIIRMPDQLILLNLFDLLWGSLIQEVQDVLDSHCTNHMHQKFHSIMEWNKALN